MKDTVLMLGGAIWSDNLFKALKEIGLGIILTDKNPNSPMRKYADEYHRISATDTDRILETVSGNDRIITAYCGGDFATKSALRINEYILKRKLVSVDPDIFTDKVKMKTFFNKAGIKTPEGTVMERDPVKRRSLHLPSFYKPIGLSGAKGVELINSHDDALNYLNQYDFDKILVEKVVTGSQHDVNGYFVSGKFYPAGLSDRFFSEKPVYPLYGYSPSVLPEEKQQEIYDSLEKTGASAGIDTSPLKGDLFVTGEGEIVYNEIGLRFHGDITSCIVLPNTGRHFPFLEYLSKLAPRYEKAIREYYQAEYGREQTVRWDIIRFTPGKFRKIHGMDALRNRKDLVALLRRKNPGDLLQGPYDNGDMLGYFLTANTSRLACEKSAREIHDLIKVEVEE